MSTIDYIKNFTKDRYVAAIAPTSSFGVRRILAKINFHQAKVIVEYGPGNGVITRALMKHIEPDTELLLIERNKNFVEMLKEEFPDRRVTVLHDDAENVQRILSSQGLLQADYIISGIPFTLLPAGVRDRIVKSTYEATREDGKFLAYQTFWQPDQHLRNLLAEHFPHVRTEFELLNAPPLRLYEAWKRPDEHGSGNGRA